MNNIYANPLEFSAIRLTQCIRLCYEENDHFTALRYLPEITLASYLAVAKGGAHLVPDPSGGVRVVSGVKS